MQASSKDHFGKYPMGTKVFVTLYGNVKQGRVCYTSKEVGNDNVTMIEFPNRVGDWQEIINENITVN